MIIMITIVIGAILITIDTALIIHIILTILTNWEI
jgi:hypothetical protein